jgi:hypothetical protein
MYTGAQQTHEMPPVISGHFVSAAAKLTYKPFKGTITSVLYFYSPQHLDTIQPIIGVFGCGFSKPDVVIIEAPKRRLRPIVAPAL